MFSIQAKNMFFGVLLTLVGVGLGRVLTDATVVSGAISAGLTVLGVVLFLYGLVGKADPDKVSHFTLKAFLVSVCMVVVLGLLLSVSEGSVAGVLEVKWFKMMLGAVVVGWCFLGALRLARFCLGYGGGMIGVAQTVLDEAIRMKIALVFMVGVLIVLPILPELSSVDKPVHYRVQTFMSWSMMLVGLMLSLMTVFLACRTLCAEIENKQIYTLAVKPLSRVKILMGKWLGIAVLDALLLGVSGGAIYGYTVYYLAEMPAVNEFDARALNAEVLTARLTVKAMPPEPLEERVQRKVEQALRDDAGALVDLGRREAEATGQFGLTKDQWLEMGTRRAYYEMMPQVLKQWMSVAPGREESYLFTGLGDAKAAGLAEMKAAEEEGREARDIAYIQLRYHVGASGTVHDNFLPVWITANGNRKAERLKLNRYEVMRIPARMIDDEGNMLVMIKNEHPEDPLRTLDSTLVFNPGDGIEILYEAGGFGMNLARCMVGMWVKLSFLAMLGLMSATFLGFPVACLLSMLVLLIANLSPFVMESLGSYISDSDTGMLRVFKQITGAISMWMAQLLKEYAAIDPQGLLVDGRKYTMAMLLEGVLWVGIVWTLVVGVVGSLIFRKRELARVQV